MKKCFNHQATDLERVRQHASLAELLQDMSNVLSENAIVSGCGINLLHVDGDALVTVFLRLPEEFSGIENTYVGYQYPLNSADINAQVFASGVPAIITANQANRFTDATRTGFERWKMQCLLVLPINVQLADGVTECIGTLAAFSQDQVFEQVMLAQFEAIADLYAPQLKLHWKCHQATERSKQTNVMYAELEQFITYITQMSSLTAVDEVFASIGNGLIKYFHLDFVNILLANDSGLDMVHTSFSPPFAYLAQEFEPFRQATRYSFHVHDGQSPLIYQSNQRFVVPDALQIMHLSMSEKDRQGLSLLKTPRTFILIPIRLDGAPIGVMWLGSLGAPLLLPETELVLLELLSSFIGTAIRNAQTHKTVEQQNKKIEALNSELKNKIVLLDQIARCDRLTGLNNFGSFEEELKRRTSECARAGSAGALSVIFLDIDHFKSFNDTYGHPAGNQILQEVAARIAATVRDMDFVARYGGEEFAVLLPQCDLASAAVIAERIRQKIEMEEIVANATGHGITISGGCAQFSPTESSESFISRVDQALYAAKHLGRNRIEMAPPAS